MNAMNRYWGKAKAETLEWHPLVFHSLDVAAVGKRYLERNPALLAQFARWFQQSEAHTLAVLTFALAVHDLGKFAENFQYKREDLVAIHLPHLPNHLTSKAHHDAVSLGFWDQLDDQAPAWLQADRLDFWSDLMNASFGHHGSPPSALSVEQLKTAMSEPSRAVALQFCSACAEMFLPKDLMVGTQRVQKASWWVAGLAVLADWLGSNTKWFPYATPEQRELDLPTYWHSIALQRATPALEESGVLPQPMKSFTHAKALFSHLHGFELRPAQVIAQSIAIQVAQSAVGKHTPQVAQSALGKHTPQVTPSALGKHTPQVAQSAVGKHAPQLYFLEDATGSGKTEAALILAARLMDAGFADGLYFGLPTMATADQLFERVSSQLPNWFAMPEQVSAVLAHGARDRHAGLKGL